MPASQNFGWQMPSSIFINPVHVLFEYELERVQVGGLRLRSPGNQRDTSAREVLREAAPSGEQEAVGVDEPLMV